MNDPALQLAVSSVLQLGALKTMFSCKAARTADCKWSFGFAVIKNESIMSEYRFRSQNYEILYCLNFANKTKNISNTTKYALLIF